MKKPRPLITRLRAARILLREWRATTYDSNMCRMPGLYGTVDQSTEHELARFDAASAAIAEAVKLLKERTS